MNDLSVSRVVLQANANVPHKLSRTLTLIQNYRRAVILCKFSLSANYFILLTTAFYLRYFFVIVNDVLLLAGL